MTTDRDRDDDVLDQNLTTLLAGSDPAAPSAEARSLKESGHESTL